MVLTHTDLVVCRRCPGGMRLGMLQSWTQRMRARGENPAAAATAASASKCSTSSLSSATGELGTNNSPQRISTLPGTIIPEDTIA